MKKIGKLLIVMAVFLAGGAAAIYQFGGGKSALWMIPANPPTGKLIARGAAQRPVPEPLRNAYFGETHVHTGHSMDAAIFGAQYDPRMAYRFASGEAVYLPESKTWQRIATPLDFVAVTDHAEGMGSISLCSDPQSKVYWTLDCVGIRFRLLPAFAKMVASAKQIGDKTGTYNEAVCGKEGASCKESAKGMWLDVQNAAHEYYQPGKFTTFVAFEYSPTLRDTGMLHRNVIFRGNTVPEVPFSAFDGFAEDLMRWLDKSCTGECQALSIPHNPNMSWGLMFGETQANATPITRETLALRARYERLVEIFQIKGSSECATGVGNNDEQCAFEALWPACTPEQLKIDAQLGIHASACVGPNDLVRNVLRKGLADQGKWGFNPFKFGFVGAGDNHNGTPGDTTAATYNGHGGAPDATPQRRLGLEESMVSKTLKFPLTALNPGGLAGVWAEENTREAIFDAMYRRETFGTSGTRISVRLFGGYGLPADLHRRADAIKIAYDKGVPMGADLRIAGGDQRPSFLAIATRDPQSAPLQKLQIVKGWLDKSETFEKVYDVACADGLQPDASTHRCPDNGAKVDVTDCSIAKDKGANELATTWIDPDFSASQSAFYYVRVLENPTCRWSQYDANKLGIGHPPKFPGTVQQRAWSSPIWVAPTKTAAATK